MANPIETTDGPLGRAWADYRDLLQACGAPEDQVQQMRNAFLTGATLVFRMLMHAEAVEDVKGGPAMAERIRTTLRAEVDRFDLETRMQWD